ncbi:uncharacterized protein JN550_013558 [Neoarthrinium moseri]|uniref:uncharacterized protein n=1 Tax=Neoarthrinium moseri TaxID=1658444 RepID=UPI001FDAED5F|nr:uncharacterized protein JN550_013558 [Neoarthrinium moseri]KAI1856956.1 hypothetical protein JN550_013558 [Neoarthrinium moseri]
MMDDSQRHRRDSWASNRVMSYHSFMSINCPQYTAAKTMFVSHDQFKFELANSLDESMLKKFDNRKVFNNWSLPRNPFSSSTNHAVPRQTMPYAHSCKPLTKCQLDKSLAHSAVPERSALAAVLTAAHEPADPDCSQTHWSRKRNRGSATDDAIISIQGRCARTGDTKSHMNYVDIPTAHIDFYTAGPRSPTSATLGGESSLQRVSRTGELLRNGEGTLRASPMPTLTMLPHDGPCKSHLDTPLPLIHLPRRAIPRQRQLSKSQPLSSPRKSTKPPTASITCIQGFYMCECCPKKPKKFATAEELRAHAAEKQYECSVCGNRFKNKNEAERHLNSLHVRRHSWSCSVLLSAGYNKAFHEDINCPGAADVCGYCGAQFLRGGGAADRALLPTEQDWDERLRHLQEMHNFLGCNFRKKFFRANHFRQHLKHSHTGMSGKWTNVLETACMIQEESGLR